MNVSTKRLIKKHLWPLIAVYRLFLVRDSYLHSTGWLRSLKSDYPCAADGEPVPWINYPMITFLQARLTKDLRVFEYGSGFSTLFFQRLVCEVVSAEHNDAWLGALTAKVSSNVTLLSVPSDAEYSRAISLCAKAFDVVLVDGIDRVNCVRMAFDHLTEQGVVILDDSQRSAYRESFDVAESRGFRSLSFEGLKPSGHSCDSTTIFYRDRNCLGI